MGFVRDTTGIDLTGGGQRKAIKDASKAQAAAGQEAIGFQREALEGLTERLDPFAQAGTETIPGLLEAIQGQAPEFQRATSSDILNNPFFQALSQQQDERLLESQAARGKLGSGGTNDALARQQLLLGQDFLNQENASRLQQAQFGTQQRQQGIADLFGLTQLGQQSAAGIGSAGLQTGANVGNLLTQIGNVQGAGLIAGSQVGNPLFDMLKGAAVGGAAGSAGVFGPGAGAGTGAIIGALSDIRLKDNIEHTGTVNGIQLYKWTWKAGFEDLTEGHATTGVLAQEVMISHPDAVFKGDDGYMRVDYSKLGVQ